MNGGWKVKFERLGGHDQIRYINRWLDMEVMNAWGYTVFQPVVSVAEVRLRVFLSSVSCTK